MAKANAFGKNATGFSTGSLVQAVWIAMTRSVTRTRPVRMRRRCQPGEPSCNLATLPSDNGCTALMRAFTLALSDGPSTSSPQLPSASGLALVGSPTPATACFGSASGLP